MLPPLGAWVIEVSSRSVQCLGEGLSMLCSNLAAFGYTLHKHNIAFVSFYRYQHIEGKENKLKKGENI